MPLDPRLEPVYALLNAEVVDRTTSPAQRRAASYARRADRGPAFVDAASEGLVVTDLLADGVPVRVYRPRDGELPALLYLHGGGWWTGRLDDSDPTCCRKAVDLGALVVSVDYRLAPEHPFPDALDDSVTAARWLFREAETLGVDAARVVIVGGSAGGNLAAATTIRLRAEGGPHFAAQVLEVPAMDLRLKDESVDLYGEGYGFTRGDLDETVAFYVGEKGDVTHPLVSPLLADLHDLPPALVTTCEYDPVRDSGEQFALKLAQSGVPVTFKRWLGIGHGCFEGDAVLPDISAAYRAELAAFLQPYLGR